MFKLYYHLTKPGIIYGNDVTAIAGFFLASKGNIHLFLLLATLIGISLGIASACVFNNLIDRKIDKNMQRTKNRALVTGAISPQSAIVYGTLLGLAGVIVLAVFTNFTTIIVGGIGFFFYEVLYGIAKRRSLWSTAIGAVGGAVPPVAGYTAVTGRVDLGAILFFLILVFWQLPHFYAIAIYRLQDYKKAGLPVLPVVKGVLVTKIHILLYTIGFAIVSLALSFTGYTGHVYFFIMLLLCLIWIVYALIGFVTKHTGKWARQMFFLSLLMNMGVCGLIMFDFLIH